MRFQLREIRGWLGISFALLLVPAVAMISTGLGDFRDIYRVEISRGEPLELTHGSGFYGSDIEVKVLNTPDEEIVYTLDGSFPDLGLNPESTIVFEGSVTITKGATPLKYSLSNFIISASGLPEPANPLLEETGTVLRIRTASGPETVATYFIDSFTDIEVPILSLIIEPDYLFDPDLGIYVAGSAWEKVAQSGEEFEGDKDDVVNFLGRGDEWERPLPGNPENSVWVDWTRSPYESWVASQAGIRIHGRTNRKDPQKSLRLYARSEYGSTRFPQDFFPNNEVGFSKRVLLRTGGNDDAGSKLRDSFLQRIATNLKVETQRSQPAAVFINGEYWGLYFVRDRYDDRYFEQMYGVDPNSVRVIDHELQVEDGPADSAEVYREFLDSLLDMPLGSREAIETITTSVDIESLFDYVALETFVTNNDWPRNNVLLWKTTEPSREEMAQGSLWRFILKDLDHGAKTEELTEDTVSAIVDLPEPYLFREDAGIRLMMRHLLNSFGTRQQFFNRYRALITSELSSTRTAPILDSMASEIRSEVVRDRQRWEATPDESVEDLKIVWEGDVRALGEFMQQRPEIVLGLLDDFEAKLAAGAYANWPDGIRRE